MFVICDCSCVCCCSSFAFSQWTLHRCHLSLRTCPALYLGDLSASLALLAPLLDSFNLDGSSAAPPLSINCLLPCFYIVSFSVSLLCPRLDRSRREVFVETRRWIFPHPCLGVEQMVTMVGDSLYIVHLLSHHVLLPYVCTRNIASTWQNKAKCT